MLTAIRSLILCEKVEVHEDGRVDYLDLRTDPLRAPTKPGFDRVHMAMFIESDGNPTTARVEIRTEGLSYSYPMPVEGGHRMVAVHLMLVIPILREGELTVMVTDEAKGGKRLRTRWGLAFEHDAQPLDEARAAEIVATAQAIAALHDPTVPHRMN